MMDPLSAALLEKILEQIERTEHLIGMLPEAALTRELIAGAWTPARLVDHLQECLAGFCAVLFAAHPEGLAHFRKLRETPLTHASGMAEARAHMAVYRSHIVEGFALLTEGDLARLLPTVFVPAGEPVMTLLLGNLEHLINHKHQLFTYIRLAGTDVATPDLYHFRGAPVKGPDTGR